MSLLFESGKVPINMKFILRIYIKYVMYLIISQLKRSIIKHNIMSIKICHTEFQSPWGIELRIS